MIGNLSSVGSIVDSMCTSADIKTQQSTGNTRSSSFSDYLHS